MPRLSWGDVGEKFYETGVDRGVLYVSGEPGVAWIGLTSVDESPSGGEAKPYYIDGVKYLNLSAAEEFEATINAFNSPNLFWACDGIASVQNGLFVTQQPRKQFGLSYRTVVGNDVNGPDHAYKIHLVYNALAGPSSRNNATLGDSSDPTTFSWSITTLPPSIIGYKRTSHLVIDSRLTDPEVLTEVENILYGNDSDSSNLPSPDDLIAIFNG